MYASWTGCRTRHPRVLYLEETSRQNQGQVSDYNRPQKKAKFNQPRKQDGQGKMKKEDLYAMVKQMVSRANKQKKMKRKATNAIEDLESFNYSDPTDSEGDNDTNPDEMEEAEDEMSDDESSANVEDSDEDED